MFLEVSRSSTKADIRVASADAGLYGQPMRDRLREEFKRADVSV